MLLLLDEDAGGGVEPSVDISIDIDGALQVVSTHAETARTRFIEQYRHAERLQSMGDAYQAQLQAIEFATWEVLLGRDLDTAFGAQLDDIGIESGVRRGTLSDDDYRALIRAQILVNFSDGTPDALIAIVMALLGDSYTFTFAESEPAGVLVYLNEPIASYDPLTVFQLLQQARSAGVRLNVFHVDQSLATTFTLASGSTLETSASTGLADYPVTTGGYLAGVHGD